MIKSKIKKYKLKKKKTKDLLPHTTLQVRYFFSNLKKMLK
jgi:hypothetical protein